MGWNAAQYLKFAAPRLQPALDLPARVPDVLMPMCAVDLGCGTGSATHRIAARWPAAEVFGIDGIADMLAREAPAGSCVHWRHADIGDLPAWAPRGGVDLIFSNAALHWLPDHASFFPALIRLLRPGGMLAVQMSRNFAAPSHRLIHAVAQDGPWRERLAPLVVPPPVAEPAWYVEQLAPRVAALDVWETEYQQVLSGADPVKEYTKGTWLMHFLQALPPRRGHGFRGGLCGPSAPCLPAHEGRADTLPVPPPVHRGRGVPSGGRRGGPVGMRRIQPSDCVVGAARHPAVSRPEPLDGLVACPRRRSALAALAAGLAWACGKAVAQTASLHELAQAQRTAGHGELAIWLAKLDLAGRPADGDGWRLAAQTLADWLPEDGRLDELRVLHQSLQAVSLARFSGDTPTLTPMPLTGLEAAWNRRWPDLAAEPGRAGAAVDDILGAPRPRSPPPALRPQAPAGQLWVYAFEARDRLRMMIDGGGAMRDLAIGGSTADAVRELDAVLTDMAAPGPLAGRSALQRLYQRMGQPIDVAARAVGASRVVLHLDGHLRELPFAALHDGRAFLGERLAFALAGPPLPADTSAGALASDAPRRMHALGVTRAEGDLPALPSVALEVCAIVDGPVHGAVASLPCQPAPGAIRGEAWLDGAFTAEQLARALSAGRRSGHAYLHLGTHFDLRAGRMSSSSLLLGNGQRLSLRDLARWRFDGHALVSLAACDTGVHGAAAAESLQFLILRQGAQAVLASLWAVEDRSASALIQAFYRALPGSDPARALQAAQAAVRQTPGWGAPRHWAGFTVALSA